MTRRSSPPLNPLAADLEAARNGRPELVARPDLFRLITGRDLLAQPDPEFLIEGVLPRLGLIELYADRKAGKTFLSLDQALCVATGLPWQGRKVRPGHVVYIALEGRAGLGARYRAWCEANDRHDTSRFHVVAQPLDLRDKSTVSRLESTFALLPEWPVLIVVDTLARAMPGGDENLTKDMGQLVAAVDCLRRDGAGMVNHHAGKDGTERGSTSLGAAADLIMRLDRVGKTAELTLTCTDAKDFAEWPAIALRLEPSGSSCVIVPGDGTSAARGRARERRALTVEEAEQTILDSLTEREAEPDPDRLITSANDAVKVLGKDRNVVLEAFRRLRDANRIEKVSGRYVVVLSDPVPVLERRSGPPRGGGMEAGPARKGGPPNTTAELDTESGATEPLFEEATQARSVQGPDANSPELEAFIRSEGGS